LVRRSSDGAPEPATEASTTLPESRSGTPKSARPPDPRSNRAPAGLLRGGIWMRRTVAVRRSATYSRSPAPRLDAATTVSLRSSNEPASNSLGAPKAMRCDAEPESASSVSPGCTKPSSTAMPRGARGAA
jgi:hypothetical protein